MMSAFKRFRRTVRGLLIKDSLRIRILLLTLPIYIIGLGLSYQNDKSVIRAKEIFPWDSRVYFELSKKLFSESTIPISIDYPWGARLLFPFICGLITKIGNLSATTSVLIVNQIAVLIVCVFCAWYWKKLGLRLIYSITGTLIFTFSFLGPLRTTMYYPGNGYAFECAIAALTYICLDTLKNCKRYYLFAIYLGLYLLALGREFSAYLVVLFLFFQVIKNSYRRLHSGSQKIVSNERIIDRRLLLASMFSITGLFSTHMITTDPRGNFPFFRAAFTNGWDHLNIFNALYPYYYALGPITLLVLLKLTLTAPKNMESRSASRATGNFFAAAGFMFSMIVGGDTDRFIWWFFPFIAGIGLMTFQDLNAIGAVSRLSIASILVVSTLWSRLFFPAIPPIQFVGEKLEAFASVRTDYSLEKFEGITLFREFQLPLKQFQFQDPLALFMGSKHLDNQLISLPPDTQVNTISNGIHPPAYKFRINEYPIPFGYLHNQYEMYSLHPQHGERKAKIILLTQWIILQFAITVGILRRSKIRLRRWV